MTFQKRIGSLLKHKLMQTTVGLLFVVVALLNLVILSSLETHSHLHPENLLGAIFSIHVHEKTSLNGQENQRLNTRVFDSAGTTNAAVVSDKTNIGDTEESVNLAKATNNQSINCESWCRRGNGLSPPYILTAVLLVRIYRHDLAGLSSREMIQWMQYLRYAGFQHVYVYDAYVIKNESQLEVLQPFIQSGYATYVDWSVHNPYTIQGTQVAAYQDCLDKFGKLSTWQAAIDIDEYPFSPSDVEHNFMERFLERYSRENPSVSEITMQNFLFLGKPLSDKTNPLLMDRVRRRTHGPANPLVKPIYKPINIRSAQVHHNNVGHGSSRDSEPHELRMNHYWGARLQNWGEDTPKVLDMTEPDFSIEPIVRKINQCSECLGQDGLYVTRWN